MICSLRSTDETNDNSFGLGSNSGTSVTTVGNGSSAPTIDVASVLGTPEMQTTSFKNKETLVYTSCIKGQAEDFSKHLGEGRAA